MQIATSHQIREADNIQITEMQVPGMILMEHAGRLATESLLRRFPNQSTFLILAGPGNNGGDGLVMARYLHLKGRQVRVLLSHAPERYSGDAALHFHILNHLPVSVDLFDKPTAQECLRTEPVIIDALLGTGIHSDLREPISSIIAFFFNTPLPVIAIDLPSGLNADSGAIANPSIRATCTLTFQLPKVCQFVHPAASLCGEVEVIDIGIWPEVIDRLGIRRQLLTDDFVKKHYASREPEGHKGSYGHVLLVGGSPSMSGAIALAALGAVKSGVGLVTVLTPEPCRRVVNDLVPEAMCVGVDENRLGEKATKTFPELAKGKSVIMMGPGMGKDPKSKAFLEAVLPGITTRLILDADALNLVADSMDLLPEETILTPHPGEFTRLTQEENVKKNRLESVEAAAVRFGHIWVLKGAGTLIAFPDGETFVNTSGNPGMGTGGTGDVLCGILASIVSQRYPLKIAVPMGIYLHGKAGDRVAADYGQEAVTASFLAKEIGRAWRDILNDKKTNSFSVERHFPI